MDTYNGFRSELFLKEEAERKNISYISKVTGFCIIAYVALQNLLSVPFMFEPLRSVYYENPSMQLAFSMLLSVLSILLPFIVGGKMIKKNTRLKVQEFSEPVSIPLMLSATALGFFICLAGNYISSLFLNFADETGVELSQPDFAIPSGFFGRLVYVIAVAVAPALIEEFAFRGTVLQPLRRYGDRFAIVASAAVFAVLHGNLVQAPFAFIAGLGIGYAVCITNSIWTGILIHFCNNLYSVVIAFMLEDIADDALLNTLYFILTGALYAVSILGSVIFVMLKEKRKLTPSFTVSNGFQKATAFITIPAVIAFITMAYITTRYISLK